MLFFEIEALSYLLEKNDVGRCYSSSTASKYLATYVILVCITSFMTRALPKEIQHEAGFTVKELAQCSFSLGRKIQLVMILVAILCGLILFIHMPLRTVKVLSVAFQGAGLLGTFCLFTLLMIECRIVIRAYKIYQARKLLAGDDNKQVDRSMLRKPTFSMRQLGGTEGAAFVAKII